jgi:hypothetical protein
MTDGDDSKDWIDWIWTWEPYEEKRLKEIASQRENNLNKIIDDLDSL